MLLCALTLPAAVVTVRGQTTPSADTRLQLSAALVLTPEFCATEVTKSSLNTGKRTFEVGQASCAALEPALKAVFFSLTHVTAASSSGDVQLVLLPRFVDIGATTPISGLTNTELVIVLEWTLKDRSGKTVWLGTAQGSAKHKIKGVNPQRDVSLLVADVVKDLAEESARKISSAPELRKFAQHPSALLQGVGGMPAASPSAKAGAFVLSDGTLVRLRLKKEISSADAKVGDSVEFDVLEDVNVGDIPVIRGGSAAVGVVTKAAPKGRAGRGGKLDVNINSARLVSCPL